ncbi:hypothetical protein NDU88_004952 [Pleurodeles waltl]|uniref:Uncharacterized protein n=1 Tax=Pleurodeles waltl TaxID=8319 RepID=A0AAV7MVC3_PLEWA|nr:hypothetical protein NDU88_004952 [Pleurodeles waltl]
MGNGRPSGQAAQRPTFADLHPRREKTSAPGSCECVRGEWQTKACHREKTANILVNAQSTSCTRVEAARGAAQAKKGGCGPVDACWRSQWRPHQKRGPPMMKSVVPDDPAGRVWVGGVAGGAHGSLLSLLLPH